MVTITISTEEAGVRLDRLLRKRMPLLALSDIYSLIRKGGVKVNGKKVKQNHRLVLDDTLTINVNESELADSTKTAHDGIKDLVNTGFFKKNFKIIFEDSDLLACYKPAGLAVHPGTGHMRHDTLIELAQSYLLQIQSDAEPLLVHRIDRDTSGVILLAKNKRILRLIHDSLRKGLIKKEYRAITHNKPPKHQGSITIGLSRNFEGDAGTKMKADDSEDALDSQTHYRVMESSGTLSHLEVEISTGRTHQIRVHMAHVGAPLVGDTRYGNSELDEIVFKKSALSRRLFLHAHRLQFIHPGTQKKITLTADIPTEFSDLLRSEI